MINLISNNYEFVVIPHKKVATCIWYVDTFRILTKRLPIQTAREYFSHYIRKGFKRVQKEAA